MWNPLRPARDSEDLVIRTLIFILLGLTALVAVTYLTDWLDPTEEPAAEPAAEKASVTSADQLFTSSNGDTLYIVTE